jgi:hypothetical protein
MGFMETKAHEMQLMVKKANPAIWVQGKVDVVPRRIYNILLWNASQNLQADEFVIQRKDLFTLMGWKTTNKEKLKSALAQLAETRVQWDIDSGKKSVWGTSALLADVEYVQGGKIVYSFSKKLKERLLCPTIYTWLRLEQCKVFKSKYSLALYEILQQRQNEKKKIKSTGWIRIEQFKKLMGVESHYWDDYQRFSSQVIMKALSQVNKNSDIIAVLERKKTGNKITHIKFGILPNKQPSLFGQEQLQTTMKPEIKDCREMAKTCWKKCFGNCGSRWDAHSQKADECFWCPKFTSNRQEADIQADVDRAYDKMKQEKL